MFTSAKQTTATLKCNRGTNVKRNFFGSTASSPENKLLKTVIRFNGKSIEYTQINLKIATRTTYQDSSSDLHCGQSSVDSSSAWKDGQVTIRYPRTTTFNYKLGPFNMSHIWHLASCTSSWVQKEAANYHVSLWSVQYKLWCVTDIFGIFPCNWQQSSNSAVIAVVFRIFNNQRIHLEVHMALSD